MNHSYFDQVAPMWDEMRQGFFSDAVADKALAMSEAVGGQTAADVGAGTGFLSAHLLARGLKVIAVEPSAAMREVMNRKFTGTEAFTCREGEAEHLPLAGDSVDFVFANMALHHVEDPPTAIREMGRVLKPK